MVVHISESLSVKTTRVCIKCFVLVYHMNPNFLSWHLSAETQCQGHICTYFFKAAMWHTSHTHQLITIPQAEHSLAGIQESELVTSE